MINRVSEVNHLKKRLQLHSATQFAIFQILSGNWENLKFKRNFNNREFNIEIYNESGFLSLYDLSSESLKNILNSINMTSKAQENLNEIGLQPAQRFNDFYELRQYEEVTDQMIQALLPFVSIYHNASINPYQSPVEVLMKLSRIDQFQVTKLKQITDSSEAKRIRSELIDILQSQSIDISEDLSAYYRVYITMEKELYRVFLKINNRRGDFQVINIIGPERPMI
jgi:hypothetical protein